MLVSFTDQIAMKIARLTVWECECIKCSKCPDWKRQDASDKIGNAVIGRMEWPFSATVYLGAEECMVMNMW